MNDSETIILHNSVGVEVHILRIGAIIQRFVLPDGTDVVLGFDEITPYRDGTSPYFGAVVGRVANRIANAKFSLDGKDYQLAANNGPNCLHGGIIGFSRKEWTIEEAHNATTASSDYNDQSKEQFVRLSVTSPDGEEGFPGTVTATVTYTLSTDSPTLRITMEATTTDAATPLNLAQHTYFNLAGHNSGSTILDHELHMETATHWTPVNQVQIPLGNIASVVNTPAMDFTTPHIVGDRIAQVPGEAPGGYDHNYALFNLGPEAKDKVLPSGMATEIPKLAAVLRHPGSGRGLKLYTTAPGVQLYSGNFLDGSVAGKGGERYQQHSGMCLETQGFPDAINQVNFPTVVLRPGDVYKHEDIWEFFTTNETETEK